ncbi:MAG TPA: Ig-like domain-containing protein [Chitinophagales bacterium]
MKKLFIIATCVFGFKQLFAQTNHAPTAKLVTVVGIEDLFVLPFNPCDSCSDPDSGQVLTCSPAPIPPLPINGPRNGTLTVPTGGGNWRYTPNLNSNGADGFTYKVCDNGTPQMCAYNAVAIFIQPVNDPPVANNDSFTVLEDTRTALSLLTNDTDVDGDQLTIQLPSTPLTHAHLELSADKRTLYFTPQPENWYGRTSFRYQACDPSNACSSANVYITVLPVNDPPTAVTDTIIFTEGNTADTTIDVLANDYDVENDSFYLASTWGGSTVSAELTTENGKAVVHVTRTDINACGFDSAFYKVCDYQDCDTGIIYIINICEFSQYMPKGFSPDGDGTNDKLEFPDLQYFKPLELNVFNRYGQPVYQSSDYQNDWDGKAQNLNQELPDGTYFYTVKTANGKKYSSMLIINRGK